MGYNLQCLRLFPLQYSTYVGFKTILLHEKRTLGPNRLIADHLVLSLAATEHYRLRVPLYEGATPCVRNYGREPNKSHGIVLALRFLFPVGIIRNTDDSESSVGRA